MPDIVRLLAAKGADLTFHDPHVREFEVETVVYKNADLTDEVLEAADLAVILTDHSGIDFQRVVDRTARIFDTRNATKGLKGSARITKL